MISIYDGIPAITGYSKPAAIAINALAILSFFSQDPIWGVFDESGALLIEPDSFLGLAARAESRVSDFPVEKGQFASYNKVQQPDTFTVRMVKSGTSAERTGFIAAIDEAKKSTKFYSIITPEKTYEKISIEGFDYRREVDNGAYSIIIELICKEIREITLSYTEAAGQEQQVKNPESASQVNTGKAQPKAVPQSTLSKLSGKTAQKKTFTGGGGEFRGTSGATGGW